MDNFNNLPTDILLDIITRLPIESILDCKLVCRPWRYLVSHHPSFSQLHLTCLNQYLDDSGKLSFLVRDDDQDLYYFEYNHEEAIHTTRKINFTIPFISSYRYNVLGSFNGLVCLYGWGDYAYCICNPVTREYVMLPKIKRDCDGQYIHCSSGFGYLSLTNEYKIVEMYALKRGHDFTEVAVYTLGSGKGWRNVGRLDSQSCQYYATHSVFVNGVLHWVHKRGERVLTLDLTEEKFGYLSPPHFLPDLAYFPPTIGILNGVLYYAIRDYSFRYSDIWLLKKNDISEMKEQVDHGPLGWSKESSLPQREPLAFTKSGGVLCFGDRSLSIYDPQASTSKKLVKFGAFNQIIHYKSTLVSMKGLAEEDIKIMERDR